MRRIAVLWMVLWAWLLGLGPAVQAGGVLTVAVPQGEKGMYDQLDQVVTQNGALGDVSIKLITYQTDAELLADLKMSSGADVAVVSSYEAGPLADAGALLPLDALVQARSDLRQALTDVYPSALATGEQQGRLIGIPGGMVLELLEYNADHAVQAGVQIEPDWNWSGFESVARKLAALHLDAPSTFSVNGQHLKKVIGAQLCSFPTCWMPFVLSNGGAYVDGGLSHSLLSGERSRQALGWLQALSEQGVIDARDLPGPLVEWGGVSLAATLTSRLSAEARHAGDKAPPVSAVRYPLSPFTGQSVSHMFTTLYVIGRQTLVPMAAAEYITQVLSPQGQALDHVAGLLPVRRDQLASFADDHVSPRLVDRTAATARPMPPFFIDGHAIWRPAQARFTDFMSGKISVDAFVAGVAADLNAVLGS